MSRGNTRENPAFKAMADKLQEPGVREKLRAAIFSDQDKPAPVAVPEGWRPALTEYHNLLIHALQDDDEQFRHDVILRVQVGLHKLLAVSPQPPAPAVDLKGETAVDRFFDTSSVPTAFGDMPRAEAVAWLCEWTNKDGSDVRTLSWTNAVGRVDNRKVRFTPLIAASQPPAPAVDADAVVTELYKRFRDWSRRGFGPDDVTWCEVKADVMKLIAAATSPPAPAVDVAAVREVITECKGIARDFYDDESGERAGDWADRLARAIGDET